jgi:hypothetical protein
MNKFKPGTSGNPSGRPKGAIGVITRKRQLLGEYVPAITQATKDLANFGDVEALTNCLKMAIGRKL